jgi:probable phosphoglycerate mutase
MKPTQLCIARHGETDWNKSGILQGWFDVPLNDLGRSQAHGAGSQAGKRGI